MSENADAFRPKCPDCEDTSQWQLAGLPAQGFLTDHLPIQPVAGWTVVQLSVDGPTVWDKPITAARPRRNWRVLPSSPHFPFHPAHDVGRSTYCTLRPRYTRSIAMTTSLVPGTCPQPRFRLDLIVGP